MPFRLCARGLALAVSLRLGVCRHPRRPAGPLPAGVEWTVEFCCVDVEGEGARRCRAGVFVRRRRRVASLSASGALFNFILAWLGAWNCAESCAERRSIWSISRLHWHRHGLAQGASLVLPSHSLPSTYEFPWTNAHSSIMRPRTPPPRSTMDSIGAAGLGWEFSWDARALAVGTHLAPRKKCA